MLAQQCARHEGRRVERTEPNRKRAVTPPEPRKRQRPRPRPAGARRVRVSADSAPAVTPVSGAPSRGAVRPRRTICAAASVDEEKTKSGPAPHSAPL